MDRLKDGIPQGHSGVFGRHAFLHRPAVSPNLVWDGPAAAAVAAMVAEVVALTVTLDVVRDSERVREGENGEGGGGG